LDQEAGHLGREDAKLQLNLIREKVLSLRKEIEESRQKGWTLSSVQSRTLAETGQEDIRWL